VKEGELVSAQLLEGTKVASAVLEDLQNRIAKLRAKGITPGLGTILVGDDPASTGYVRKKHQTCEEAGMVSFHKEIPATSSQADLLAAVDAFNQDDRVHAFIIQYPLPKGFDFAEAMQRVKPEKDADGLHPVNLGKLVLQEPGPVPCTPAGIRELFVHYRVPTEGREVVVVGRGPTLGRPLALLLSLKAKGANAAVTVVHSGVPNIGHYTRRADIVIAAVGSPSVVTAEMVKPGAVVVSGGITWQGKKLLPDVDEAVADVASWITPRLGGVGPTTVAMLLRNTVEAAERHIDS
jgi:methylenetetrahydrofolate dehydrogenase (NADP+)/methenyltetrahydrofolate cyclohydrolase